MCKAELLLTPWNKGSMFIPEPGAYSMELECVADPAFLGEGDLTELLTRMHWSCDVLPPPSKLGWLYDHLSRSGQRYYNASWYSRG